MTAQTNSDIIGRLGELESRIRVVEDTDAIRNLKARYAELWDDDYNPDGIASLFVVDGVWGGSREKSPSANSSRELPRHSPLPSTTA